MAANANYKDLTLIMPTLNEAKSIERIVKGLRQKYSGINILVVDDGSTDGTDSIVGKLSKSDNAVSLLERRGKSRGLTASVIDGMMTSKTKFVAVMDADLQHPIDTVKNLYSSLSSGNDIAVAFRERVDGWPLYRKLISQSLSALGMIVLLASGKKTTRDIFSGFFGIRRNSIYPIIKKNRPRFVGEGYKVLFDLLKCINSSDSIKIGEVPYTFRQREFGLSKAGTKQALALLKSFLS